MFALRKLLCFCVVLWTGLLPAETRHALVIGNDTYPGNNLQNARNDATGVFEALRAVGYSATLVLDADRKTLSDRVDAFADSIRVGDTALLYYAGHGMQVEGENYLVPVDFKLSSEASAKEQGYSLSSILERLTSHGAKTQVVILDACRDNPFLGSRSMRGGWAGMGTSAGTFLAFGTSPGSTASDDPGGTHGLFTKSLLRYLTTSDLDVEDMFRKVREGVIRDSGGKQVPWVSSSLIGSLHILPAIDAQGQRLAPLEISSLGPRSEHSRSYANEAGTSISPPNATPEEEQIQQALTLARGAHFQKAIDVLKSVVSLDPRCAIALRLLGLMFHSVGRDLEAADALDRAVSTSGGDPRAAAYKCALETYQGARDSVDDCAALVRSQPSSSGYLGYAAALLSNGENEQAYTAASQAIALGGDPMTYALRGMIANHQGRAGLAERDFNRAAQLTTQPDNE
jgi:Flp pilus assembly protein TadD